MEAMKYLKRSLNMYNIKDVSRRKLGRWAGQRIRAGVAKVEVQ